MRFFGGSQKKMSTMSLDLWQRGCERLAAELPEQQFNTWIRPLAPTTTCTAGGGDGGAPGVVAVSVPNRFKLDWIRTSMPIASSRGSPTWPATRCGWN